MKINRVGSLGETYTDPESGSKYVCVSVYKDSMGNVDCEWHNIDNFYTDEEPEYESVTVAESPKAEIEDEAARVDNRPNKHTNYNNYNKYKK